MRHHPAFFADVKDFDADPWLLNTPDGVFDLRTGVMSDHGALMRMQTLVTPCMASYNDYERACPGWVNYLNFVADGRDWVIPFLQRWGGYNLIGMLIGVYFLFIHGLSGTGKTVFVAVLQLLLHTYGKMTSKHFFMRKMQDLRKRQLRVVLHLEC